ncbi:MAG: HAMP domain-containing histidine kinase [Ferruginibacter sp.]|nr:HAMP domain-containing histidine kinase [Ferruginibacter sp.]
MYTQTPPDYVVTSISKNLHQLVASIAGNLLQTSVKRDSFIVNEITPEFQIATDEKILATVLNSLLSSIVNHTKQSCIRVKASAYEDIIFVSVREAGIFNTAAITGDLEHVKLLANKINGNVTMQIMENKFTDIQLSFPNFPRAT